METSQRLIILRVIVSGVTAFTIGAGSVLLGVIASGYTLNRSSWICAAIAGAVIAAKDTRSLLQLPPVEPQPPITKLSNEKSN